jgi:hypothetical protein
VGVGAVSRCEALEHRLEIAEQERLVLVDHDGGGGVQDPDLHDAVGDPGTMQDEIDPVRQVDELRWLLAPELDMVLVNRQGLITDFKGFHVTSINDASRACEHH